MAHIIEATNEIYSVDKHSSKKIFLAGGISNCPDWQAEVVEKIKDIDHVIVYNPRRQNFPIDDPFASEQQITWEYEHLRDSDIIVFWFSKGSLNPIVLYELGKWGNSTDKKIIIGIDPDYERKMDVIIQTKLARPHTIIVNTLEDFIFSIRFMLQYKKI